MVSLENTRSLEDALNELWEAAIETNVGLQITTPKGATEGRLFALRKGRRISISTEDREMNQEMVADRRYDVFANGTLLPVKVPAEKGVREDGVREDGVEVSDSRPPIRTENALTDREIAELVGMHTNALKARLAKIDSIYTVERVAEVAASTEGVSTAKQEAIQTRIQELRPPLTVQAVRDIDDANIKESVLR